MDGMRHLIVIDPGHGGNARTGGSSPNNATGPNGLLEKNLTLDMAQRVRNKLQGDNIEILMTRDEDVNLGLTARAQIARDNQADMFMSIHFNGWDDPQVDGTVTFTGREANAASQQFAQRLQSAVVAVTGVSDRGVRARNFSVIIANRHHPNTAAVLLEVAFLTNPDQAQRLTHENYKEQIANAIANSIRSYLGSLVTTQTKSVTNENIPLTPETGGMSIGEQALEVGDIIVSTTSENISRIIRHVTSSKVSHSSLYVGDGMVVEAVANGITLTTLEHALSDDSYAVALRCPELTVQQKLQIRDFAGRNLDVGYNFVGISRHLLYRLAGNICRQFEGANRLLCEAKRLQISFGNDDSDRWYCSELIFAAYEHAGVSLGVVPRTSTPETLVSLTNMLAYVGHLKSYPGEHGEQKISGSNSLGLYNQHIPRVRQKSTVSRKNTIPLRLVNNFVTNHFAGIPVASVSTSSRHNSRIVKNRVNTLDLSLTSITHAGSYRIAYDRLSSLGVIEPLPGRNTRNFRGTVALQEALNNWSVFIPTVMRIPNYILTGGVYVDKTGEHGLGNAIDIDGFWWSETDKFLANDAPTDWYRYLTIEASLRKAFGTVLNYDYNSAHHDHWHCDLGRNTSWRAAQSQAFFVQRALKEIWGENISVDGVWGDLSNSALNRNDYDFTTTGGWDHFLDNLSNRESTVASEQQGTVSTILCQEQSIEC